MCTLGGKLDFRVKFGSQQVCESLCFSIKWSNSRWVFDTTIIDWDYYTMKFNHPQQTFRGTYSHWLKASCLLYRHMAPCCRNGTLFIKLHILSMQILFYCLYFLLVPKPLFWFDSRALLTVKQLVAQMHSDPQKVPLELIKLHFKSLETLQTISEYRGFLLFSLMSVVEVGLQLQLKTVTF